MEHFSEPLFRAAAFQTIKPAIVASQTAQPTQVAGFNQLYDDRNGTQSRLYGLSVDARIAKGLYTGAEVSRRDLDSPPFNNSELPFVLADQRKDNYSIYLCLALSKDWAVVTEFEAKSFNSSNEATNPNSPLEVKTLSMPLSLLYSDERGFFGNLGVTYVNQDVVLGKATREPPEAEGDGSFVVVDAGVGYRLPERRGLIGLEITNVLDEKLRFQDDNFRELGRSEMRAGRYIPERALFARAAFNF